MIFKGGLFCDFYHKVLCIINVLLFQNPRKVTKNSLKSSLFFIYFSNFVGKMISYARNKRLISLSSVVES